MATIKALNICIGHKKPMLSVVSFQMKSNFGIEGDRHASIKPDKQKRQVLTMDNETLDVFCLKPGDI